ncbi:flagellar biosynthetic protein FlhB [Povalibacter uvarum]|uniref:Flagellar biosynthetic protein FlhB n=1 Tax=Povalibacter uvarum TaxID=732238 RepID=A0A841HQ38_9GAMM|nr:flagellar biosynthesis protein FlhB [Povalibacter uvarum]MBB6094228.1 flagellar biosynthetic protein FlhB [Povalibacter uvarum]
MAEENEDGQEKTESATPKRLEEARRKGQIPRSRDLSAAAVLMTGGVALSAMGGQIGGDLYALMRQGLTLTREQAMDPEQIVPMLASAGLDGLMACVPVLGLLLLAAILAPLALGGWSFSTESIMPQFNRLNPLSGIKRIFAMRSIVELMKALAKFGVVAVIAAMVLWKDASALLALGREPTAQAIMHAVSLAGSALILISAGMLVIAGVDVPYQLWQYAKQLKMTREEVRQEMKESEGSPEVKGRIRQIQQQMARQRMMQDVPNADVIVTNPTHFAVALKYDEKRMRAPIVVAKGVDLVAARIREIATEHSVPIFEAPPLARVLYKNVDIGGEVPSTVYVAVAQVLSYIFQLRTAKRAGTRPPPPPVVDVEE